MSAEMEIDTRAFEARITALSSALRPAVTSVVTNNKEVEKYWPILEGGSGQGQRPWPNPRKKTMYGPNGRIFSKQAPEGFVRVHADVFVGYLISALAAGNSMPTQGEMQAIVRSAATKTMEFIRKTIPVDTGMARDSIWTRDGG